MAARANLESRLSLDDTSFRAGLRGATTSAESFAKSAAMSMAKSAIAFGGATLAVGALTSKFHELRNEYDRIGKLATRMDLGVVEVQKLGLAAELSGSSLQQMSSLMTRLDRRIQEQISGLADHSKALEQLNLNAADFIGLPMEEKLQLLAKGFAEAEKNGVGTAAIMKLMDTEGREMIPMLRDMTAALEAAGEAKFLDESSVRKIEAMNDRLTIMTSTVKVDLMQAFLNLEPVITRMAALFGDFSRGVGMLTGSLAAVDNEKSADYIAPGSFNEGQRLLEYSKKWNSEAEFLSGEKAQTARSAAARAQERFDALPEKAQEFARSRDDANSMLIAGKSADTVTGFLQDEDQKVAMRDAATAVAAAVAGAVGAGIKEIDSSALASFAWDPSMLPLGASLADAGTIDNIDSFEDLTGGEGVGMTPVMAAMASMPSTPEIWKRGSKSTFGRVAFGGLAGVEREGSSFGKVAFGGLAGQLSNEANARIGDPRPLKEQDVEIEKLDAAEQQVKLLKEQNTLLKENLSVS